MPLSPMISVAASLGAIMSMRDLSFNIWADCPTSRLPGERSSNARRASASSRRIDSRCRCDRCDARLVDIEGLDQIVRCAFFEGRHRLPHVGKGRHQDEVGQRRVSAHGAQQGQPVDSGQAHVAQDDIEHVSGRSADAFVPSLASTTTCPASTRTSRNACRTSGSSSMRRMSTRRIVAPRDDEHKLHKCNTDNAFAGSALRREFPGGNPGPASPSSAAGEGFAHKDVGPSVEPAMSRDSGIISPRALR